jgi:hypothetical protein
MLYINNMEKHPCENTDYSNPLIIEYFKTFNDKDLIAYKVAQQQLQTSLNLNLSNGFIQFKRTVQIPAKIPR